MSAGWHSSVDPRVFQEKRLLGSRCFQPWTVGLPESQLSLRSFFKLNFFLGVAPFLGLGLKCSQSLQLTRQWLVWYSALGIILV